MRLCFFVAWYLANITILFGCLSACSAPFRTPLLVHDNLMNSFTDDDFYPFKPGGKEEADASEFNKNFHAGLDLKKYQSHKDVKKWVYYFTQKNSRNFITTLERGFPYQEAIAKILCQYDLPPDLYYLALIESGFNPTIKSSANAVGFWQFMAGTGKRFGLNIDSHVDERRDPIRATEAAAKYLSSLHKVFNSWPLALAAYNAGENRVMNAIINYNTRDFWKLSEYSALPRETRQYVPKILAAIIVASKLNQPKTEIAKKYSSLMP